MKSFLAGIGLGFGVGLVLAPDNGAATRKKVMETLGIAADQMRKSGEPIVGAVSQQVGNLVDASKESAQRHSAAGSEANETVQLLEIVNSASKTKLMSVKGIGDATARRIMDGRPYDSADGAVESILSEEVLANLKKELLNKDEDAA